MWIFDEVIRFRVNVRFSLSFALTRTLYNFSLVAAYSPKCVRLRNDKRHPVSANSSQFDKACTEALNSWKKINIPLNFLAGKNDKILHDQWQWWQYFGLFASLPVFICILFFFRLLLYLAFSKRCHQVFELCKTDPQKRRQTLRQPAMIHLPYELISWECGNLLTYELWYFDMTHQSRGAFSFSICKWIYVYGQCE